MRRRPSRLRVLEHEAAFRQHVEPAGGFQERVGEGFPAGIVLGTNHRVKKVVYPDGVQGAGDNVAVPAGGDCHRLATEVRAGDVDDPVNRLHRVAQGFKHRLLVIHQGPNL